MSDSIQTVVFNKTHRLTAKPLVSLEMPLAIQQFQSNEGMPAAPNALNPAAKPPPPAAACDCG